MRLELVLRAIALMLAVAATAGGLPVETADVASIPENFEARRALRELVLAPRNEVMRSPERIVSQMIGVPAVRYEVRRQDGHFYQLFTNQEDGRYELYNRGSYIIKRRLEDGAFVQIKIFYRSAPGFFVRLFPAGNRTVMDLYVAGVQTYDGVVLPISFRRILFEPFARLQRMSEKIVRWDDIYRRYPLSAYTELRKMVAAARNSLTSLPDAEDGAMDADGELVFIESLVMQDQLPGFNCSGFAKWVCDGLVGPATGTYLSIDALKEKHLELRGHQWSRPNEEERDPYFGLDWSRNLARHLAAIEQTGSTENLPHPEALDVRDVPFSQYVEDVGYPVKELPRILYFLAQSEPGTFYIASLNREFGEAPTLRQHVHVAVIFPYFDAEGEFELSVMERNVETSLESLEQRYRDDYVHLVRVRARDGFVPPGIRVPD